MEAPLVPHSLMTFLQKFPREQALPDIRDDQDRLITHPTTVPHPFIPPSLSLLEGDESSTVSLISASAAVGKSYLARYLAATAGAALWDLSRGVWVGSRFFSGTLAQSYGGRGYASIEEGLEEGGITLVIDGLDEALVKAGIANYESAINDLISLLARQKVAGCRAVLLGRPESLDFAAVLLSEGDVTWNRYEIDFFDDAASRRFVHAVAKDVSTNHNPDDIDQFLDVVFELVSEAIGAGATLTDDDSNIRSFLGYSPVLDALGRLASENNAHATLQGLKSTQQEKAVWALLCEVMNGILVREGQKILGSDSTERDQEVYGRAFAPDEQVRLLLDTSDNPDIAFSPEMTKLEREAVRDRILLQRRDHPYVGSQSIVRKDNPMLRFANVALRDYVASRVLTGRKSKQHDHLISYLTDPRFSPSPLMIRLIMALGDDTEIPGGAVGHVMDSAGTQLGSRHLEVLLQVTSGRDKGIALDVRENGQLLGRCSSKTADGVLRLNRVLSHATIYAQDDTVVLGTGRSDFELGPEVVIVCHTLMVAGETLRVPNEGAVRVEANEISGLVNSISASQADLMVAVNIANYPWTEYKVALVRAEFSNVELYSAGLQLKRTTSWFLRRAMSSYSYPRGAFDIILNRGRASRDWFEYLKGAGGVTVRSYVYELNLPCSLSSVKDLNLSDREYRRLLEAYLKSTH